MPVLLACVSVHHRRVVPKKAGRGSWLAGTGVPDASARADGLSHAAASLKPRMLSF